MLACRRGRISLEMGRAHMGLLQSLSLERYFRKECRILIESGSGRWQRSRVQKANKGDSGLSDYRTSSTTWIDPSKDLSAAGKVCMKIRGCAKLITGIVDFERLATSELQLVKYEVGQEYKAHYDGRMLPDGTLEARGTFLVYLNDGFEGGETYFPNVGIKVKPERGKAILWYTHLTDQGIEDSRFNSCYSNNHINGSSESEVLLDLVLLLSSSAASRSVVLAVSAASRMGVLVSGQSLGTRMPAAKLRLLPSRIPKAGSKEAAAAAAAVNPAPVKETTLIAPDRCFKAIADGSAAEQGMKQQDGIGDGMCGTRDVHAREMDTAPGGGVKEASVAFATEEEAAGESGRWGMRSEGKGRIQESRSL
ncbi:unnamed protein product [Closterium sp. Yama58-4]|nr:unnamed protein product [Closterium sp. Yama58-4]